MALLLHFVLELHQMDMKTNFLSWDLEEMVYICQPQGFYDKNNGHLVCKLQKSIYALNEQTSRQ